MVCRKQVYVLILWNRVSRNGLLRKNTLNASATSSFTVRSWNNSIFKKYHSIDIPLGRGEPRSQGGLLNSLVTILQLKMNDMKCSPRWWMWANLRLTAEDLLYMRVEHCIADPCFIPSSCRLLLKGCYVDGIDWINMECAYSRSTLYSVFITEIEVVSFGDMKKGHMMHVSKSS